MIDILLADDHDVVRHGERALLASERDFRIVGEAGDGIEAVRLTERLRPQVLVVDIAMPCMSGIEVLAQVRSVSPRTASVVFTMHTGESFVAQAFRNGAAAYVSKAASDDLIAAARAVARGERFLGRQISERAVDHYLQKLAEQGDDPWTSLTAREREVLLLAAEGLSNAQIGARLFISPRTVETHRASVMRKLGLRGQTELVLYVVRRGLMTLDERV